MAPLQNIVPLPPINPVGASLSYHFLRHRPMRGALLPVFSGFTSQDTLKRGLNDTKAAQRWRLVTLFETQKVLGVEVCEVWCNRVAVEDTSYQLEIHRMLMSCFFWVFLFGFLIEVQSNAVTLRSWLQFLLDYIGTLEPGRTSCPASPTFSQFGKKKCEQFWCCGSFAFMAKLKWGVM